MRLHRLIDGSWTYQQEIYGSNTSNYFFGHGVSLSEDGDVLAVGEYDQADYGLVRMFRHNGSQWVSEQNFRHSNYGSDDQYGFSGQLESSRTRLAVGARYEDGQSNNINNQGAVYLHDYIDDSWTQTIVLRASDAASGDFYGWRVALNPDGSQLVVTGGNAEAVYHYDLSAEDSSEWQSSEQIFASPASDIDEFGSYGLAFNGNAISVGAYNDDNAFAGYVSNTEIDADFNENDTASVGTFDKEDDTISNSGAAYLIRFDAYALSNFTTLQTKIDESNTIFGVVIGGETAPDESHYANASIDDVTAENVSDVNAQLQTLAHTDMANVQPMVNAINKILAYTTDSSHPVPTNSDYTLAGIDGVNADNADTLNGYVGGQSVAVADIQALVTQVDHLLVLRAYSADATNTEPILANFTGAGVTTSRAGNLDDYNSELVNQTLTTETQFQALVDAINALDDYADGTTTTAPSFDTYSTAGFPTLNPLNVNVMNTALSTNVLITLADIQSSLDALDNLVNYALDESSTNPSVADYTNAGLTSVSADILDYLNNHLGKEKRDGLTHYLKASDAHASDHFGYQTAITDDGMTLAVLAHRAPSTSNINENGGAVYVYRRDGNAWIEVAILRSEQTSYHAWDMAMTPDGHRIVMLSEANAYIFDVPMINSQPDWDGTWTRTNYNHGETSSVGLYIALSADGKTMVVGDGNYSSQSGRIRIHQEVNGTWTYRQQHIGSSNSYFGEHGVAVNSDGSVIAVGAYYESSQRGYVDIYRQSTETSWTRTRNNLGASNGASSDYFGWSVSLNREGDRLAVGARYEDGATNAISNQGAVYIFDYDGSSWNEIQILRASDAASGDDFGEWVVLTASGDQLAVSTQDAEAVYTYDLSMQTAVHGKVPKSYLLRLAHVPTNLVHGVLHLTAVKSWSGRIMMTVVFKALSPIAMRTRPLMTMMIAPRARRLIIQTPVSPIQVPCMLSPMRRMHYQF